MSTYEQLWNYDKNMEHDILPEQLQKYIITRAPDTGAWGPPVLRGECEEVFVSELSGTHELCVCVCVFFPFILDIKFVGRTSRGHTGGRSHRISHPPSFGGACLNFSREKDSAIPFPRRP